MLREAPDETRSSLQIAANSSSVLKREWNRWKPSYKCVLGGAPDWDALTKWMPLLANIDIEFLSIQHFHADGYFAQSERRFSSGAEGIDVLLCVDADTFLGDIEEVLDQVHDNATIAGVQAHYGFPTSTGNSSMQDWISLADTFLGHPMRFDNFYSLASINSVIEERSSPFYINGGAIFVSTSILSELYRAYSVFRRETEKQLKVPYFAGQVSIALAVESLGLDPITLPVRYNFPNDPIADARYPEDLEDVRILHFLRNRLFDWAKIFSNPTFYSDFLRLPLEGSNRVFQEGVRRLLGESFPFQS